MRKKGISLLLVVVLLCTCFVGLGYNHKTASAYGIYYPGLYKKKISGTTYYLEMNKYSSDDSESDGNYRIWKKKRGKKKVICKGELYEFVSGGHRWKNMYRAYPKGCWIEFDVKKKSIYFSFSETLPDECKINKVIRKGKANGKWKLVKRFQHP